MPIFIGWDVSTAIVGVCAIDENGDPFVWDTIDLRACESMAEKYKTCNSRIRSLIGEVIYSSKDILPMNIIEERLGGFSKGFTNQNTLMKLAQINAVCSFIIGDKCGIDTVSHLAPVTVKAVLGIKVPKGGDKKAVFIQFARDNAKGFPYAVKKGKKGTPKDGVGDMADAYALALAGLRRWNKNAK